MREIERQTAVHRRKQILILFRKKEQQKIVSLSFTRFGSSFGTSQTAKKYNDKSVAYARDRHILYSTMKLTILHLHISHLVLESGEGA